MTDDRRAQIEQTVADLETQGIAWTNQMVYAVVGGQYGQLAEYLRERRAGATGTGPQLPPPTTAAVAVLEPPAALGEPVAPPPTPTLHEARERAQACARSAAQAVQAARALADQLAPLQTRVQELTAVRAKGVESVDALRALKTEIVSLEEHIEVVTSQQRPLARAAQTQLEAVTRARQHYEQLRVQAILLWQNARPTRYDGPLPPDHARLMEDDRARSVRALTALIGQAEVDTYLPGVRRGDTSARIPPTPPWVYKSEIP